MAVQDVDFFMNHQNEKKYLLTAKNLNGLKSTIDKFSNPFIRTRSEFKRAGLNSDPRQKNIYDIFIVLIISVRTFINGDQIT